MGAVDGDSWSISRSGLFAFGEIFLYIHWVGIYVDTKVSLNMVPRRKSPVPTGNQIAVVHPVVTHYTD
jgi:hypothetical protein